MSKKFKDKNVVVTGSSKGIGLEIARSFKELGAEVLTHGSVQSNKNMDLGLKHLTANFLDNDEKIAFIKEVKKTFSKIDYLILNAGKSIKNEDGQNSAVLRKSFEINYFSQFDILESLTEEMSEGSAIVWISSITGIKQISGAPFGYSVSKNAVIYSTHLISKDLAKKGIRINSIAPGNILHESSVWKEKLENEPNLVKKILSEDVPLGRLGNPKDIVAMTLFLCGSNASFITGQNFVVDGGQI